MALTVSVNGFLTLNITYNLTLDDHNTITSATLNDDIKFFWNDVMDDFLSTCFGTYEVNVNDYTLTFTDPRDYMRFCLEIAGNTIINAC